jgi:transcriptional regulator with XRE-family HTH domain
VDGTLDVMVKTTPPRKSRPAQRPPASSGVLGARIRARRRECGLGLQELAARTGLTAGFISLVERNISGPSLESLRRIAEVLEVPLFYFADANGKNPVVRHDQRLQITFPPGHFAYELLVPDLRHNMEMFLARVHPSAGNIARAPKHDSEECIFVLGGRLRVRLNDATYVLGTGDSIYFHGSSLQEICAQGRRQATFISVITPPVL